MASVIKAGNATDGVQVTSDNTGILELKTGTGAGTTAMTVGTDQSVTFAQAANLPNTFGFKNRIINGAMMIDQRNAGATITNGSGTTYNLDRWLVYDGSGGSHFSIAQNLNTVTPPAGFVNYLGIKTTSAVSAAAGNNFTLQQYIEGFNIADLAWGTASAKSVTISFWVYSSLTGQFGGSLRNDSSNYLYPFTYTISSANTWEQKTITIAGPTSGTWLTNNGRGIAVLFDLGLGSNFQGTAGAWTASSYYAPTGDTSVVGTLNATFYITGVQLEKGSTATSFDYRPYGTELQLCQRYFASLSDTTQQNGFGAGVCTSTTALLVVVNHPVPMRSVPTFSLSGTFQAISAASSTPSSIGLNAGGTTSSTLNATTTGLTAGNGGFLRGNGSAVSLNFSAEL